MKIFVTGGAGYVGSVVVEKLIKDGHTVVVYDNLQQGHQNAVHPDAYFIKGDLSDIDQIEHVFEQFNNIEAVFHLAGETLVGGSTSNPQPYFQNNVVNGLNLLNVMCKHDVKRIVFSSTAAVYGNLDKNVIDEKSSEKPITSYGESKLMFEKILNWYYRAYDFKVAIFRYFNAAGATGFCGEQHTPETHLIPLVLQVALGIRDSIQIYGSDYETSDGTCIRDFVHVFDIANAHVLALDSFDKYGFRIRNIGSNSGSSVLEVVNTARKITGHPIPAFFGPRREGDPARLVASSSRMQDELGWKPDYVDLYTIISSAWNWVQHHPHGYDR
jgi:UDP-glucose 4-epimerase